MKTQCAKMIKELTAKDLLHVQGGGCPKVYITPGMAKLLYGSPKPQPKN